MAEVALRGVAKRYGKVEVIHGIDLDIRHGEFTVFVGPSGCGKSTLLRMVAGLEPISDGEVRIAGRRVNELPPRQRDIAMVFQDYALYPHKTLFENMAFGLRLRKTAEDEIQRRVMNAARLLRIDHMLDRRPAALSGGQLQRVAIGLLVCGSANPGLTAESWLADQNWARQRPCAKAACAPFTWHLLTGLLHHGSMLLVMLLRRRLDASMALPLQQHGRRWCMHC